MKVLSQVSDTKTFCYPNAGLPNPLSETGYDETPEMTADGVESLVKSDLVNFVGGCCGTTPEHIEAICNKIKSYKPRLNSKTSGYSTFSGLELLKKDEINNFLLIGERTNVTGSPKFSRLIKDGDFESALDICLLYTSDAADE